MCDGHRNGTRQGIVKFSFLLIIFKKKKETRESDILTLRYYITNNKPRQIQSPSPPPKKRVTHTHRQDRKKGIRHLMLKIASRLRSSNMLSAERERQLKWTWAALYSRDIIRLTIEKKPTSHIHCRRQRSSIWKSHSKEGTTFYWYYSLHETTIRPTFKCVYIFCIREIIWWLHLCVMAQSQTAVSAASQCMWIESVLAETNLTLRPRDNSRRTGPCHNKREIASLST